MNIAKFFRIIVSMHGSNTENDFPEPGLPITKRPRSIATMLIHPLFTLPLYTYLVGRLTDVGVSMSLRHCLKDSISSGLAKLLLRDIMPKVQKTIAAPARLVDR